MGLLSNPLVILGYHGIVDDHRDALDDFCFVDVNKLRADLKSVSELGWQLKGLREGMSELAEGKLSKPTVAITFDDGFSSVLNRGKSVLEEFGVKATIFLPTRFVTNGRTLWFTDVISALKRTKLNEFVFLGRAFRIESYVERVQVNRKIQNFLRCLHPIAIDEMISELHSALHLNVNDIRSDFTIMNLLDCERAMGSGVFDFGAHSASHAIHSQMDHAELSREIDESLNMISSLSGNCPLLYAYPNGRRQDFSTRCEEILARNNVACALTTIPGWNFELRKRFQLKRFCIGRNTNISDVLSSWRWRFLGRLV